MGDKVLKVVYMTIIIAMFPVVIVMLISTIHQYSFRGAAETIISFLIFIKAAMHYFRPRQREKMTAEAMQKKKLSGRQIALRVVIPLVSGLVIGAILENFATKSDRDLAACNSSITSGAVIAGCSGVIQAKAVSGDNLAKAFNNRGAAYLHDMAFDLAVQDYDKAISLSPTYVNALTGRCGAYIGRGDYDKGILVDRI